MSLLLKNALVIDSRSPFHNKQCDLFIDKGIISSMKGGKAATEVDLRGCIVSVGWFDLNANFNDPGKEHKEDLISGVMAAKAGGFTDVQIISDTTPPLESKSDVEYIKGRATHGVDIYVSAALSESLRGENLTEMLDLYTAGASSFSDGDHPIWNSELLLKSLQYTAPINVPIIQNPRDRHLSNNAQMHEGKASTLLGLKGEPSLSEELIIRRDLEILKYSGGKIHFSRISTAKAVDLIQEAKKAGLNVTADVSIHHLLFSDENIGEFDTNFKNLPPFRRERDRKALIDGVNKGIIDAICSNHRPQDTESKQLEFDYAEPGSISIQTFYPSLRKVETEIPLEILFERITYGPRAILGTDSLTVAEGFPAKLTICHPDKWWVLDNQSNVSKSRNSPFWGQNLQGQVIGIVNGEHYSFFDR